MMAAGGGIQDSSARRGRGVNPILGIVLLFGMVIVGATMLFVVGSPLFDSVQSQSERERAHNCMDEADHQLTTVALSGSQQSMPTGDISDCQIDVSGEGQIDILWYNDSGYTDDIDDLPWDDDDRTVTTDLGALEFELSDRTIAHEGGGVWEATSSGTQLISEPGLGFDNHEVRFNIMQLNQDELSDSDPVAKPDHDSPDELAEEITNAASNSDGNDVAIRVSSSYHDGWNQHLEQTFNDGNSSITHSPDDETVEVLTEEVRGETETIADLIVTEDYGIQNSVSSENRLVHPDDWDNGPEPHLEVSAEFENIGDEHAEEGIGLEIVGKDGVDGQGNQSVSLDPNENETNTLGIPPGQYRHDLEPGNIYEYDITIDDDSALDESGSFYVGKDGSSFNATEVSTESEAGNKTIEAGIENIGVENGTQDISLEFDHPDIDSSEQEIELGSGSDGTADWTINESAWESGSYPFTIGTDDDSISSTLEIGGDSGADEGYIINEDLGVLEETGHVGDQTVDVTESQFTLGTEIENMGEDEPQDAELEISGTDLHESQSLDLEIGDSDVATFDLETNAFEPGEVYEYNVTTENDGLTSPGAFYVGESGSEFTFDNATTSSDDGTITLETDLQNIGTESGEPGDVTLDLEYLDGETPEEYELEPEPIADEYEPGQFGSLEWELNESRLLDGEFEATISAENGNTESSTSFDVIASGDSSETGIGVGEPIAADVTVLGSQVSTTSSSIFGNNDHGLIPTSLGIVTESGGERTVQHEFENEDSGNNVNTYDAWQDKGGDAWSQSIEIDEDDMHGDEVDLTLSATSEYCLVDLWCSYDHETDGGDGYTHHYNDNVDPSNEWINVDATTDDSIPNVRVRDHENDTVPELRAQHDLQMSSDEILEQEGLWDDDTETLDLDEGEYVFLFEVTDEATNPNDVDDLWDQAQETDTAGDPNFNDLIVHVDIERANVEVGNPAITLTPQQADSPEYASGESGTADGDVGDAELTDGTVDTGSGPDLSTGNSDISDEQSQSDIETGVDVDADHIVIG